MSSYHSSFTYLDKNSNKDFHWLITHFEADEGETESYLSQNQIYTDSYNGSRRILYGTKWNAVAVVKITVVKQNFSDFTESECRSAYRWLTGRPKASYLDLYVGDTLRYAFLGTVQDVKPQKLDARTVGLNIYFESVSPWAYSPLQTINCNLGGVLHINSNGVVYKDDYDNSMLSVSRNGTLNNGTAGMDSGGGTFSLTDDGTIYIDNVVTILINNETDDLYSFVNMNTTFTNVNSTYISVLNSTLSEETKITNIALDEIIALSSGQFITSNNLSKTFGDSFNYIWPRLAPGVNNIIIQGDGSGDITFEYRYPIKIGDCAIDVDTLSGECSNGTSNILE